jgi:hypothetical protein
MTESQRIELIRKAHQAVLAKEGAFIEELLPPTKEDVLDESAHLDALDHEQEVDFDQDENEIDMTAVSPAMREAFA